MIGRGTTTVWARASCEEQLAALDVVYDGVVADHRETIEMVGKLDPITEDILIGQTADLEQFQWFIRAHLETSTGRLDTQRAKTEMGAAKKAVAAGRRTKKRK